MQKVDIRIRQATDFLERAAQRLPKGATRKMWQRVTVPLICKRISWKGRHDSFLRQFEKLHGCTVQKFMAQLWSARRERLKPKRTVFPLRFQVESYWFYVPHWLRSEEIGVGDWVEVQEGWKVRKIAGPEQKAASG